MGFEHRFRVLTGNSDELYVVEDKNKALARLFIDIYGVRYTGHPRFQTLLEKNEISRLDFLTGAEEAKAFEDKRFVALHQSTLRKVDVIANVAGRAHDRTLKTNTSWWEMHGGGVTQVYNWITDHPKWGIVGVGLTIITPIIVFACQ